MKYLKESDGISLEQLVGKTIASVEYGYDGGEYGDEPVIYFVFTDGTFHGVCMPPDTIIEEETAQVKEG